MYPELVAMAKRSHPFSFRLFCSGASPLRHYVATPPSLSGLGFRGFATAPVDGSLRDYIHPPPLGVGHRRGRWPLSSSAPMKLAFFTQGSALRRFAATRLALSELFYARRARLKFAGSLRAVYAGGYARLRCHLASSIVWQLRGYSPRTPLGSSHHPSVPGCAEQHQLDAASRLTVKGKVGRLFC